MFYRAAMMEGSGTLEDQLEATKVIYSISIIWKCAFRGILISWK